MHIFKAEEKDFIIKVISRLIMIKSCKIETIAEIFNL